ncbi:hypothetical protein VSDG_06951 [Cytospora chrysosperma]|uniref:J domain-containing protein n=1 Tax=Cytospora chrysosperma TaxID=252740 RepID=A0A423VRZ2_CYTCH|nr:hypothetical protein VSDG_06951 [Valsa sordida]
MPLRTTPFRAAAAAAAAAAPLHLHLHFPGLATTTNIHQLHRQLHNKQRKTLATPYFPSPSSSSFFHSTPASRRDDTDDKKTHYEVLQVQTDAPPADIKRSFYALSKANHPDHNQHDPAAAGRRFVRISEAYSVLSSAERRAAYDRDVLRLHDRQRGGAHGHHHGHGHGHGHHHRGGAGSYSSTGPAGGRPASGLSRRRGTFHGPPPSFYRNGGWGAHQAKRSQAHEESTAGGRGTAGAHYQQQQQQQQHQRQWGGDGGGASTAPGSGFRSFGGGGMGPGVPPHFDRAAQAAHTRTQARVDEIRRRRLARENQFPGVRDWGESGSFFAVLTVLGIAIGVTYFTTRKWDTAPVKEKKKDWSKTVAG